MLIFLVPSVDGFALLVMGTLIFNKLLRIDFLPCVPAYPVDKPVTVDEMSIDDDEEPAEEKTEEF